MPTGLRQLVNETLPPATLRSLNVLCDPGLGHQVMQIVQKDVPAGSLIAPFAVAPDYYADAFSADARPGVDLQAFLAVFYRSLPIRAERQLLRLAGHGSTDEDVTRLANDDADRFAMWSVETRREDEILLGDLSGRTKSWLKVEPIEDGTRLWFGSILVPFKQKDGSYGVGNFATALIGPHRFYSRVLLRAAAKRLAT